MVKTNTNAIRGRLGELNMHINVFQKALGIGRKRLWYVMSGRAPYNATEIEAACRVLNIPAERIPDYFFNTLVPELSTKNESEG